MVNVSIYNDSYSIDGYVAYTDAYTDDFETFIDISIKVGNGYLCEEKCWFNQSGVFLSFSSFQGNERFLLQNGLKNFGENMFYIIVSDDKHIIPNSAMLEKKLTAAVNKYKRLLAMINR